MKIIINKFKYIIPALLVLSVSCGFSNDFMENMDEYATDPLITISGTLASDAFYNNDRFTITCTPSESDLSVRYTTDGSDPSRTAGTLYSGPVTIESPAFTAGTIQIRAVSYDPNRISGIVFTSIALGDGTSSFPFEITTPAQLKNVSDKVNDGTHDDKFFIQMNDLDLGTYVSSGGWSPIGGATPFTGSYDGADFVINNLKISRSTDDNQGLFGIIDGSAQIKNINFTNAIIQGKDYNGVLAGRINGTGVAVDKCNISTASAITGVNNTGGLIGFCNNTTVTNCSVDLTVTASGDNSGGLIGYSEGSAAYAITSCTSSGSVTGVNYAGGLIGNNGISVYGGSITVCSSSSTVTGQKFVGGLAGVNSQNGSISSSFATGAVTATVSDAGGLAGNNANSASIADSYTTGNVNGVDYTGGLAGQNLDSGAIGANNYATGTVTGSNYTGGLIGQNTTGATVGSTNRAEGDVTGTTNTGGFAGSNSSTIGDTNYATGVVNGTTDVGGFAGASTGPIGINNYSTGDVTGTSTVGGFVGTLDSVSSLTLCYSTGTVSATGDAIGGFAGNAVNSNIAQCYSKSDVTISGSGIFSNAGGFIGRMSSTGFTIKESFSRGDINCTNSDYVIVGGFAGKTAGDIVNCYSTGNVLSSSSTSGGFIGLKTDGITSYCYSTGDVTGTGAVRGGFIGEDPSGVSYTSCYWLQGGAVNTGLSTEGSTPTGKTGVDYKTQTDMYNSATFTGWDFATTPIWNITETSTYPFMIYETGDYPF